VPDIVAEVHEFGIDPLVADPLADLEGVRREYGISLVPFEQIGRLDAMILAVPHRVYAEAGWKRLFQTLAPGGIFVDVKSAVARDAVPGNIQYWSL